MDEKNEKKVKPTNTITNPFFGNRNTGWAEKAKEELAKYFQFPYSTLCFEQKSPDFLIPNFIGIKKGEITLVWEECYGKGLTKAVLNQDEGDTADFELGFLIAYYKKTHENWKPEILRAKIVQLFEFFNGKDKTPVAGSSFLYGVWNETLKGYLRQVFIDNCRLDFQNAERFLKYIFNRQDLPTIVIPKNFIYREEKGDSK